MYIFNKLISVLARQLHVCPVSSRTLRCCLVYFFGFYIFMFLLLFYVLVNSFGFYFCFFLCFCFYFLLNAVGA